MKIRPFNASKTAASIALVAALAACSAESEPEVTPAPETSEPTEEPTTEEPEETEEAEEPTDDPSPTAETTGTRESPMQIGETRRLSSESAWTVGVTEVNMDAAEAIRANDSYAPRPAEGETFIMAMLEVTVNEEALAEQGVDLSNDGAHPYMSIYTEYVGSDGHGYSPLSDPSCYPPDPFANAGAVYVDGATVTGNECIVIPTDVIEGGLWRIANHVGDAVWIEAN